MSGRSRASSCHRSSIAIVVLLSAPWFGACATTPEPGPVPVGVEVTPLEQGALLGARAIYTVDVPPEVLGDVLLDFSAYPVYRETILDAELLSSTEDGGTIMMQFRGVAGIDPRAICRYSVVREGDTTAILYEMADRSVVLRALRGGFILESISGGARTLVTQEFLLSAIIMNREQLLVDLRADAMAIRDRAEAIHRGE